jgi:hypothetical protein
MDLAERLERQIGYLLDHQNTDEGVWVEHANRGPSAMKRERIETQAHQQDSDEWE